MPFNITATAQLTCSFGMAPSVLSVIPSSRVLVEGKPAASVMDFAPMTNIAPFGMCMSLSNPIVAAATSAALGVLTPMPCLPVTTPWKPGASKTKIGGLPALTLGSTCQCNWGGIIQIMTPAVKTVSN
jgi:uncharacterized Zn-binding protein involved in type VI secretion